VVHIPQNQKKKKKKKNQEKPAFERCAKLCAVPRNLVENTPQPAHKACHCAGDDLVQINQTEAQKSRAENLFAGDAHVVGDALKRWADVMPAFQAAASFGALPAGQDSFRLQPGPSDKKPGNPVGLTGRVMGPNVSPLRQSLARSSVPRRAAKTLPRRVNSIMVFSARQRPHKPAIRRMQI